MKHTVEALQISEKRTIQGYYIATAFIDDYLITYRYDYKPTKAEAREDLIDRYGQIMKKAQEEYEYEPPSEYFTDGYNLYKRMQEDAEDYYDEWGE